MADAAQRANLLRESITKLPAFNGDGTDALTPEQWIARIEKVRVTTGWTDEQTMSFMYTSLRGVALTWYEGLSRNGIADTYAAFRPAFLACFAPMQTARSAVVTLHDVKQGATELVVAFHSRVLKVLNDLEAILPPASRTPATRVYPAAILAVPQFVALADNVKDAHLATMVNLGVTIAVNHIGIQMFVAGLKSSIRDKMMENMPNDLYGALQRALDLEKIHCPPSSRISSSVNEISNDMDESEVDGEIEAIQRRLAGLQNRRSQFRSQGQNQKSRGKPSGNKKTIICRCCEKIGHMQEACYTRINKRLPCVDQNGVPLRVQPPFPDTPPRKRGGVSEVDSQQAVPQPAGAPPTSHFAPPTNHQGFWTPFPPNFP